jgi:hypothetical protein
MNEEWAPRPPAAVGGVEDPKRPAAGSGGARGAKPATGAGVAASDATGTVKRRRPLDPEVVTARKRVLAAREALEGDLDTLSEATRSAMDIPAKVRKAPVRSAALAGGAGFLLLGGPRRVMRAVASRVLPRRDPYEGLLPAEIDRILRDAGAADLPGVREAIEHDFADYLRAKGKAERKQPNAATSLWRTYDAVVGPMGTVAARLLVERLFAADPDRKREG